MNDNKNGSSEFRVQRSELWGIQIRSAEFHRRQGYGGRDGGQGGVGNLTAEVLAYGRWGIDDEDEEDGKGKEHPHPKPSPIRWAREWIALGWLGVRCQFLWVVVHMLQVGRGHSGRVTTGGSAFAKGYGGRVGATCMDQRDGQGPGELPEGIGR
ncbi:MAG: hypothetical protein JWR19_1062 [Pedosphaera sp.]|nr:hypothetical protein [Pedosphaera sp.]